MLKTLPRLVLSLCFAIASLARPVWAADPAPGDTHHFKVTLDSKLDMTVQGQKQHLDAVSSLRYNWTRSTSERVLVYESVEVKTNIDGKPLMDSTMSRAKMVNVQGGKTDEVSYDAAPDALKKMLRDSFDVPVYKLQVDQNTKELKRTVVAGEGAKDLIANGLVANALLFHPPFYRDQEKWTADSEVTMGNGGFARGRLQYQKVSSGPAGIVFKVSGTLANESFQMPPVTIKNATYVVNGEETYDPRQREWVAGKMTMDITYKLWANNQDVGGTSGTMVLTFQEMDGKPAK